MKRYNIVIISSLLCYLLLAFLTGYFVLQVDQRQSNEYRVDSNRIVKEIQEVEDIKKINLDTYTYIKDIQFLDAGITDKTVLDNFYLGVNEGNIQIQPFYQESVLKGYVKYVYTMPNINIKQIFSIIQISLLILEGFLLVVLLYLKRKVIMPFQQLTNLPMQLARGHYKGIVKEEKSRYLGKFMWGMGQLKDSLDTSRKRELALIKEKKKMLLSLSHDIKTPLNLIKLYGKALEEDIYHDEEVKKEALHQIGQKVTTIEKYVEEIVKSSREDILDLPVNNSEFYLEELMTRITNQYEQICSLQQIDFIVGPYDNKLLKGDIERSEEVIENILENAFKYGDGKRIEITFFEEEYCQLIRIFNTGKEILDTEINHLFESFYRGINSKGKQGSGLGLYICKELMRKMDGAIFIEKSEEGMSFILVFR